jgi:hypothetical protein
VPPPTSAPFTIFSDVQQSSTNEIRQSLVPQPVQPAPAFQGITIEKIDLIITNVKYLLQFIVIQSSVHKHSHVTLLLMKIKKMLCALF